MTHFLDIIILLLIVIALFIKLKSLLGTRPESSSHATPLSDESAAKIFDIIMAENEKNKAASQPQDITPESELSEIEKKLQKLPSFNQKDFLSGAKRAFEIIITAFAKFDIETLESLVSPKLVKKFKDVLNKRQTEGISAETDLIGFTSADITDVKLNKNDIAQITVKFVSEQVNLLKNDKNEIIEGDENFVQNITDIWTFERCLTSSNPNWLLVSTKKS